MLLLFVSTLMLISLIISLFCEVMTYFSLFISSDISLFWLTIMSFNNLNSFMIGSISWLKWVDWTSIVVSSILEAEDKCASLLRLSFLEILVVPVGLVALSLLFKGLCVSVILVVKAVIFGVIWCSFLSIDVAGLE